MILIKHIRFSVVTDHVVAIKLYIRWGQTDISVRFIKITLLNIFFIKCAFGNPTVEIFIIELACKISENLNKFVI